MTQAEWNAFFEKADREAIEALERRIAEEKAQSDPDPRRLARWETKLELLRG